MNIADWLCLYDGFWVSWTILGTINTTTNIPKSILLQPQFSSFLKTNSPIISFWKKPTHLPKLQFLIDVSGFLTTRFCCIFVVAFEGFSFFCLHLHTWMKKISQQEMEFPRAVSIVSGREKQWPIWLRSLGNLNVGFSVAKNMSGITEYLFWNVGSAAMIPKKLMKHVLKWIDIFGRIKVFLTRTHVSNKKRRSWNLILVGWAVGSQSPPRWPWLDNHPEFLSDTFLGTWWLLLSGYGFSKLCPQSWLRITSKNLPKTKYKGSL